MKGYLSMRQTLNHLYCKEGKWNDTMHPLVMNRVISFKHKQLSSEFDLNIFTVNTEITRGRMFLHIPKVDKIPFVKYIKKLKEKGEDLDFLFDKIKKYYKWSNREFEMNKDLLLSMFDNKDILKDFFEFFGVESKYYKKYEIDNKPKLEKAGLERWS